MHIVVHPSLAEIDADQWNRLVKNNNPFTRHEFLFGLEETNCVTPEKGWKPTHIAVYSNANQKQLIGAMPGYIKAHSYGEYIFDWAWADAHQRHGLEYYPKLSNAVPFTPATGERLLLDSDEQPDAIRAELLKKILEVVEQHHLSSFHSLFCTQAQSDEFAKADFMQRRSTQFHWRNKGYQNFDDFLAQLSSKKRKNIKRERRRVQESGIEYRWLSGDQLDQTSSHTMYQFYSRTIAYYGAQSYLNEAFFNYLASHFSQQTLFLFAEFDGQIIAGGLYFISDDTLYGRYWGALNNFHSVHFETCYYQAIEWCIGNGYQCFEAGAQGEHKLARGLEPTTTYSSHWISHPDFRRAIDDFLESEKQHIDQYQTVMASHSPYKAEL